MEEIAGGDNPGTYDCGTVTETLGSFMVEGVSYCRKLLANPIFL